MNQQVREKPEGTHLDYLDTLITASARIEQKIEAILSAPSAVEQPGSLGQKERPRPQELDFCRITGDISNEKGILGDF